MAPKDFSIIIVGYGRMGREIERQAQIREIPVAARVNSFRELREVPLSGRQAAVEFTNAEAALENVIYLLRAGVPVVSGSTPWSGEALWRVEAAAGEERGNLMISSNFSIGVHLFWTLVRRAAQLFDRFPQYDVAVTETHHRGKRDAPSGTALRTAEIVLEEVRRKEKLQWGVPAGPVRSGELHVSSLRLGSVPGDHGVYFQSEEDTLELRHSAHSRAGFAAGALEAAGFLADRLAQGMANVYSMNDLIDYLLDKREEGL